MIKKFLIFLAFSYLTYTQAQYTEIINSNRPGFSESPYSVGTGVYQFETNLFYRKADAIETFSNPQALGLQLHFRTSLLFEKLELNLTTSLQKDKIAFKNVFTSSYDQTGLGELTVGAKYLVFVPKYTDKGKEIRSWRKRHGFDFRRWIPHASIYAGVNFGSLLNDYHKRGGITPKVGVLLQNEFSNQFNLITNVYYNYIGSEMPEWSYILTATYNFNNTWAGFIEHQALFNSYERQSNLGGGLAYLFNNNLQINGSLRATFQEETLGYYGSLGVSYRLDRHVDKFIELDEFGNKIENPKTKTYNKGFFGRLLDKVTGVFKRKEKTEVDIEKTDKDGDKKIVKEEVEVGVGGRTRQKSVLKTIIKNDKKQKKQKVKADKKEKKKATRKAEKEKRKAEKQLRREEKQKAKEEERARKEQEKLEKEVKKLEKELKKQEELERLEEEQRRLEEEKKKKEDKKNKKEDN